MSRRTPRATGPRRTGGYGAEHGGRWSSPWVIRIVAITAGVVLVVAIAYAAVNGFLFSVPSR